MTYFTSTPDGGFETHELPPAQPPRSWTPQISKKAERRELAHRVQVWVLTGCALLAWFCLCALAGSWF